MDLGLKDRVVIVTGAGGGIGREVAKTFAEVGSHVMVCDINEQTATETRAQMKGDHSLSIKDLSEPSHCRELIQETVEKFGRLDILVNVAAIIQRIPIEEITEEAWDRLMNVNLKSQFFLSQEACRVMALNNWGRIVNFSSQGGFTGGYATSAVYAITKGAVLTMTKSFARTYAPQGICVNAIAPGGIDTEMMKLPASELAAFEKLIPMQRLGKASEMVGAVLFLSSEWASYMTGATVDITGGQMMR